jgi:hypothetical protein
MQMAAELLSLLLQLRPKFDHHGNTIHIDVRMVFDAQPKPEGCTIFRHIFKRGPIRIQ